MVVEAIGNPRYTCFREPKRRISFVRGSRIAARLTVVDGVVQA